MKADLEPEQTGRYVACSEIIFATLLWPTRLHSNRSGTGPGRRLPDRTPLALPRRDAIADCVRRCAGVGTPIAEYVPDWLVNGRLALVGDAAHVPTQMTGMGFGASLDAETIAESLRASVGGSSAAEALRAYERKRLGSVRRMVQSGQQFSRGF